MGIYDREYYRREGPSYLGSFAERGKACKWLIGLNIVLFIAQMVTVKRVQVEGITIATEEPVTRALELSVPAVMHGEVWRLLTYSFLHTTASLWHILFNMLFLGWFGFDVEDIYGPREFVAFYLSAAFLGGVAYTLTVLMGLSAPLPCIGASGAVTAVLVLCAIHFPTRVIYLFMLLPVPIWLFVVAEVAMDAYTFFSQTSTLTAVSVHLAGALFAWVYHQRQWRMMDWVPRWQQWRRQRARPRLRVYREEEPPTPVSVAAPTAPSEDEHLEARMDAILEKISRSGKESLTEGEREFLLRASEIIKRRRR